jgi:hypothetical protein
MRNMSFMLTTQQIRDRTKKVTRRVGWWNLKPGDLVCAVVKGMGLRKGEKVERLCTIRIVSTKPELLNEMLLRDLYGRSEVILEGFPNLTPTGFVRMFCESHSKCTPTTMVNRIEFEYVDEVASQVAA